jgi:glucosamine-phosphate N-acetyltransferase
MNPSAVMIEPIQQKHIADVILLLQDISIYLPPRELYEEIWETFISQSNVFSIVATHNGKVVGYGSVVIETKIRGGKVGHIEDVVSHSEKRNKGLGKMITDKLFDIAKTNNCYKVSLQCQQQNIQFYEKCEYKRSGTTMQRFIR